MVTASTQDLSFKIDIVEEYLNNQLARMHYNSAQKSGVLKYLRETSIDQIVVDPDAKKILEKFKIIKRKDNGPFIGTLSTHAEKCNVSLERLLIELNDRELKHD